VARDAFNGVTLWQKPFPLWEGHLRDFRSGPADLPRRLVAVGDKVYVTLGYGEPVSCLDAATGNEIRTYKDTAGAREIVVADGRVHVVGGDAAKQKAAAAKLRPAKAIIHGKKSLHVLDAETGAVRRTRPPDKKFFTVGMGHHRCHRNQATSNYLVLGRAGVEFIDVKTGKGSAVTVADGKVFIARPDAFVVHALNGADGTPAWQFVAGSRVDSPPTIWRGRVLFGCNDGWIYCLRATDGALAWRFRAASEERRIVAYNRVESPWPVPGSVLVHKGVLYAAAGRSSFLDGGIRLVRLDATTGKLLGETATMRSRASRAGGRGVADGARASASSTTGRSRIASSCGRCCWPAIRCSSRDRSTD
jgi:outer membrane protein assembly factor BamB